ncbi:MAG: energy-coupling factor transporter transmembrane component T [Psychrilyobacter sp.]|uniref:energy-coupling factor transporter transmembrane component T family protein n=1 Tax=Psychrilyobacter sp. TaxID=2586924 RepID=UPI003C742CF9
MFKEINPIIKLICNLLGVILSFMVFTVGGLFLILGFTLIVAMIEGNLTKKSLLKVSPLLLFGVGVFITNLLWGSGNFSDSFSYDNFILGLKLFLRIVIIGSLAMSFLFNIDPNRMLMSLMQNLKLNPGLAYGVMVAFRFFPMMENDMNMIKHARNIRLGGRKKTFKEKISLPIPLLATNIRRAERVAIAMEGRGFDRFNKRTHYKNIPLKLIDAIYLMAISSIFIVVYFYGHGNGNWLGY